MKKAYFQYYETFEKIVQKLETSEDQNNLRQKIINYGLYGQEPDELTEKEGLVWDIIKDLIDDQIHRREVNRANRAKRKAQLEANQTAATTQSYTEEAQAAPEIPENIGDILLYSAATKTKRFVKPTVEEVRNYCAERKNTIQPQQFWDYYEARGWKIGKNAMKDWKAAVRTWEQRRIEDNYKAGNFEWPDEKLTL